MKTAIVTGANGFVGSAVINKLLTNGIFVYAIVHNGHRSRLHDNPNMKVISCDMAEYIKLEDEISGADIFYHFAWCESAGPQRVDNNLQLNNVKWSLNAIKIAKKIGCSRFVSAGTIMENETMAAAYLDGNKPSPPYIYGGGKTTFHLMAPSVATDVGIDLIWGKITNTYGPGETSQRLVNTTIRKCINKINPKFTSGVQNYDFVYIDDVAEAFYKIGFSGKPFVDYVIGSSNAQPLRNFLIEMNMVIAPDMTFEFGDVPYAGVNLPLEALDCSKTERDTGFRAKVSFAEGCMKTKNWIESVGNNGTELRI